jgi:hypothetical protein
VSLPPAQSSLFFLSLLPLPVCLLFPPFSLYYYYYYDSTTTTSIFTLLSLLEQSPSFEDYNCNTHDHDTGKRGRVGKGGDGGNGRREANEKGRVGKGEWGLKKGEGGKGRGRGGERGGEGGIHAHIYTTTQRHRGNTAGLGGQRRRLHRGVKER